eukprot:2926485-Pleurochrysis_carterae.AAC.3
MRSARVVENAAPRCRRASSLVEPAALPKSAGPLHWAVQRPAGMGGRHIASRTQTDLRLLVAHAGRRAHLGGGTLKARKQRARLALPAVLLGHPMTDGAAEPHGALKHVVGADLAANTEICAQSLELVAVDVKAHVARVERRVVLGLQVKRPHHEPRAAMPARPPHAVELQLHSAKGACRVIGLEGLEIFELVGSVQHGSRHVTDVQRCALEVVVTHGKLAVWVKHTIQLGFCVLVLSKNSAHLERAKDAKLAVALLGACWRSL